MESSKKSSSYTSAPQMFFDVIRFYGESNGAVDPERLTLFRNIMYDAVKVKIY